MIRDLKNYKMIIFDFDDTLCIHSRHSDLPHNREYNKRVLCEDIDKIYPIKECRPNVHMQELMDYAADNSIMLGLLSATMSHFHMHRKVEWVKLNYGYELDDYSVGKKEDKVAMLEAISDAYGFCRKEILFIDDCWETVASACDDGFEACSPMEVVNCIHPHLFDKIKTYDMDKVLEKLEAYKEQAEKMRTKFFDGESIAYEMVIKIIKRGGIDEFSHDIEEEIEPMSLE